MSNYTKRLLESAPFTFSGDNKQLFVESFKETAKHHYLSNSYFRFLWDKAKINPDDIRVEEDIKLAPPILVDTFKEHELISCSTEDIALTLGSSGTSGQRSLMHLDERSLANVKKLAYNIHEDLGITSHKKYNYLCFTYDPAVANDLGTAFTDELLTSFTDKNEVFYAFEYSEEKKDFVFNEEKVVSVLKRFSEDTHSTRILGFPAFLYQILMNFDFTLNLGSDSWLQTGGGWKALAKKEIPKSDFRELVNKRLGIPTENIRDMFGMVEHGIPYMDCHKGHLRVPNYARVYIRNPHDMSFCRYGERGLVQLICTYNTSYPSMNLLTTDWGMLREDPDGLGDILVLMGRAGVSKSKGCALKASEMLL